MSDKKSRISPTSAALLLAALVGGMGTAPGAGVPKAETNKVQAQTPQNSGTRSAPTASQSQVRSFAAIGGGRGRPRPGQRYNLKRQARRVLEEIGYIHSGRHWRNFRKFSRRSPLGAQIMQLALQRAAERVGV